MTETAYGGSRWPEVPCNPNVESYGSQFHVELENAMSLMPIASSPQDSNIPLSEQVLKNKDSHSYEPESTTHNGSAMRTVPEDVTGNSGPVKLLGEEEQDDTDMEVFQLTEELDLEQIENH